MNIGIIVFSRTGNTLLVAERLRGALLARGHSAAIERVHAENEDPSRKLPVRLTEAPDPARFDAVIFASPVEAFSLSPVMKLYLSQMPRIAGKAAGCFVTQHFPKPWLGGNRAVRQMRALCAAKGAEVGRTGVVNWTGKERDAQIGAVVNALSGLAG